MYALLIGEQSFNLRGEAGIVEAQIRAIVDTSEGTRLQVSFSAEIALVYLWQVVEEC